MVLVVLSGCFPPWTVVVQQEPNPLLDATRADLATPTFYGLQVGRIAEAEYLGRKSERQRADWSEDKRQFGEEYRRAATVAAARCDLQLDPPGGPGTHTVATSVGYIEPGFYAGMVSIPSEVRMSVQVTRAGSIAEEIAVAHGTEPGTLSIGPIPIPTAPSVTDRLRADGAALGRIVGQYLCARKQGR
ncbi:MAG: hypothetical protein EXR71_17645 [Myxococcales bacterium]|nr:hypothetical protein [Myxococcales bacterium]